MYSRKRISIILLLIVVVTGLNACVPVSRETGPATGIPTIITQPITTATPTSAAVETGVPAASVVLLQGDVTSAPVVASPPTPEPEPQEDKAFLETGAQTTAYKGPGTHYGASHTLSAGTKAFILGRDNISAWWAVAGPGDGAGPMAWVSGYDVTVSGDGQAVPVVEVEPLRVQFQPGATSATLSAEVVPPARNYYVFRALAGQQVNIEITSPGNVANFALSGLADGQPYKRVENESRFWSGTLQSTQDYRLTVATPANAAKTPYTLTLTIEPLSSGPADVHPIVDGRTHFLLGAWRDGQWLSAEQAVPHLGSRSYALYDIAGRTGTVTGVPPVAPGGVCANPTVVLLPSSDYNSHIALAADWEAAPRSPQWLPVESADYHEVVADVLRQHGLEEPEVQLSHVLRVDLEGDGVDEVLIGATRLVADTNLPPVAAGDYSLVLLRKVVGDSVVTVPLRVDVYSEAEELAYPYRYEVTAVLDLNGDGTLEVIVHGLRYEGEWVGVFQAVQDGIEPVLVASCSF